MCSFPSHSSATRVGIGTVLGRNEPCFLINILLKGSIILKPKRFSYKDANGHDTPIYLQLEQVAAIVVTPAEVSAKE
jgi:hypothetical protein